MDINKNPLLTYLSFSGGKQSSCLLWMVILGKIETPNNFVVLNADPGMENSLTYKYVEMMKSKCDEIGIYFKTVRGPNLYQDIINLKNTKKTRFDNPPYWTKNKDGSMGRLTQGCTQVYKIYPMDREIRRIMQDRFGISIKSRRLGNNVVEKWIGFTISEAERVKSSKQKYAYFRYPLIDLKMTNRDVLDFFKFNKLPLPPRSVCNACFANGTEFYREMYSNRKDDWDQAIRVDQSVRDWTQIGIKNQVYVSNTLVPLEDLPNLDFHIENLEKDYSCDSGYCFL